MATDNTTGRVSEKWPSSIGEGDHLIAIRDSQTGDVEYLMFSSAEKNADYVRDNGSWVKVGSDFTESISDPAFSLDFLDDISSIDEYDRDNIKYGASKPVTAAAGETDEKCPPATLDIALNLKNRARAISVGKYGPLDPSKPNDPFWQAKADNWGVSIDDARKSVCGNCAFFVVTSKMRDCIASGLESGGSASDDAWDAIDVAQLGYCEAFDFKCAASRTCDAWVVGGPITDDVESGRGAE